MLDFGSLETDNTLADRELLMKKMLTFFGLEEYIVGIGESDNTCLVPGKITCYPNPFKHSTTIEFSLVETSTVHIEIYDLSGNMIRMPLRNQQLSPGNYSVQWDAKDEWKTSISPGIYIYQIKSGNTINTGKLVKME